MRVGLTSGISPREPMTRVPEIARLVEDSGFDRLWYVDYQLPMKDSIVAMTLAAQATSRIKVGPGVANPVTRHVSVLANAMSAINELSEGRAMIGIGGGHTSVYGVGLKPYGAKAMERVVQTLKHLVAGEEVESETGKRYQLHTVSHQPPPPICMAATQEQMLRVAGRVADAVILMGAADISMTQWQLDQIYIGLEEAGRSRDDIDIESWFALSMGDPEKTVPDIKAWAAAQSRVLNRWKGELPSGLAKYREQMARADEEYVLSQHLVVGGQNAELISDELALRLAVAGEPETCASRIRELVKLGLDGVTITLLSGGREERIKALSSQLLPLLDVEAPAF